MNTQELMGQQDFCRCLHILNMYIKQQGGKKKREERENKYLSGQGKEGKIQVVGQGQKK